MTDLCLHPAYSHRWIQFAPKTILTADTAKPVYDKLRPFLAIKIHSECPAAGWPKKRYARDLFAKNGFHHPVRWMSIVGDNWRRLYFDEFCVWYGILP